MIRYGNLKNFQFRQSIRRNKFDKMLDENFSTTFCAYKLCNYARRKHGMCAYAYDKILHENVRTKQKVEKN